MQRPPLVAVVLAVAAALSVVVGAVWWSGRTNGVGSDQADRLNVVLVVGCTVRRDQLSSWGGPDTTPFLDRLAATGTRFADTLGASTWTKESLTAVLTGRHALSVGIPRLEDGPSTTVLHDRVRTLAEHFETAGYRTIGLTANPNLNASFGYAQGFEHYTDTHAKGFATRNRVSGTELVDAALAELDAEGEPFFLQLVLIEPHTPRKPTPAEVDRFRSPDRPKVLAEYDALLRRLDTAVERLHDGLGARQLLDDTLFVFITDHGEGLNLPEHHRGGHGKRTYATTAEVAWILAGPGVAEGHVVEGIASQVDVLPTVLGLAGLASNRGPGHDWSAQVSGAAKRTERRRAWTSSHFHNADVAAVWTDDGRQCQADFGSHSSPMVTGCFDRQADPWFEQPAEDPELHAELVAWRSARMAEFEAFDGKSDADLGEDVEEQLRELGYLD